MQIGEFVARLSTTKETVRHYEDLQLLTPTRVKNRRTYGEKDAADFAVILELKSMGLGLKEVQLLFALKRAVGCGDPQLLTQTVSHLSDHLASLRDQEAELRVRIAQLEMQLAQVKQALTEKPGRE